MSNFDKLLEEELEKQRKKKEEEEKKKKQKQQTKGKTKQQTQSSLISDRKLSYLPSYTALGSNNAVSQNIGRVESALDEFLKREKSATDVSTTGKVGGGSFEEKEEAKWFKGGGYSDGFDWYDVPLTMLGTVGDAGRHLLRGAVGMIEGIGDAVMYDAARRADYLDILSKKYDFLETPDSWEFDGKKVDWSDISASAKHVGQQDLTTSILGGSGDWLDQYSFLGKYPDAVMEGIGQVALMWATGGAASAAGIGAAGVTALTTGMTAVSGVGSGMSEAYQGNATDEEAAWYGLIAGTADAATELFFGGMGKGINALGYAKGLTSADDILAKSVSKKISNTIAKNAVEFGIKAGAEGAEEVMAGFLQAVGKEMTYMSEEDFGKILADENLLEQFIVGAMTSAVAQSPDLAQSNKAGKDFITGNTKNDQAVVDKVVKDRIAEMEAEGKTVTAKDKSTIKAEVQEDLERGYISTDTIEEMLGGDKFTAYQDTIKQENDALAELAELYEGDELKQKTEEFLANSKRSEAAKALRDSVFDTVKDSKLGESYLERARRGQKFTADLTKYDEKQRAIVQKAIDSGVLNNTNRTHDMVDFVSRVAADTGVSFDFTNNEKLKDTIYAVNGKTVDGYITKDGVVLNVNSKKYINTVVGHEITHALEGTKLYEALESAVFEYAKANGTYKDVLKSAYDMYHGEEGYQGYEGLKAIKKEAVANMVGDYLFTDKKFISHLSAKNPNIFQKVWNEVKYMAKLARAGSDEAKKLIQVQKAFEEAYRSGGNTQSENSSENIKYSLENNGKRKYNKRSKYSETETLFLSWENGSTPVGEVKKFSRFGKTRYYEKTESGSVELSKQQYIERNKVYAENTYRRAERRFGTTADYDETTQRGLPGDHISYRDTSGDAAVFGQTIREKLPDVTRGSESSALRDGTGNADINQSKYNEEASAEEQDASFVTFSNDYATIRNFMKDGDAPVKYSLSKDSDGKQLSKEQQEYFKDSKMRDADGSLKVMYHGSQNGGFHVFDPAYSDDDISLFFVDRNDVAMSYSGTSETYAARTFRTAEDFNKFFAEIGADEYEVKAIDGELHLYEDGDLAAVSNNGEEIYEEFRDLSGLGYGDVNYKVYLNLTNPLVVDAKGSEWSEVKIPKEHLAKFNETVYQNPDPYGYLDTAVTRDFAQYAKEQGYDGVIFKNIRDNGGFSNGSEGASTVAIAFDSNQIKSVANTQPTGDPDIRYSLSEDSKKLKDVGLEYDAENETVSYSLSSLEDAFDYNRSEADYLASRLEYETALAKSIAVDKENVTAEEMDKAKRYLDSLFLIHDMIAMDRDRLDYEAAVGKSAWVSNAEYGGSIDFSTLCAKRRLFTGTFDAIQNELPDTVLDENDFLQIRNMLLEKELESPCSMCYVEGSRAKHGVYVAKFLKEYKQTNPAWIPQIADFTSTTRLEQTRINHPEAYEAYVEAMNSLSQRKPKEASVRTDYRGEILRDFKDTSTVAEKNKNGGVRFNSFSDFEIIHAIDCMQVLTDMARVGLNGQAYTKVKEFAEAFGNTGLKINLSLVAKDVDANGKLIMDETNGMKYEEAMDLRDRYSENVGTVIVVFNEAQLRAALADSTIDYVLPFHRSQWKKSQYTMMGLPTNTKDFTNYQNDRIKNPSTGRDVKLSKIKHISQYTNDITGETFEIKDNIMPNQYWDFNLDGRANAQRYLDYINANGMTPKFSFLLNKVDGKWVLPADDVGNGYFKLLIDFKMYDNDGWGSPQNPVVPEFNMPFIQKMLDNYKGGHQAFPVAHDVVSAFVEGKKSGKYSLSNEDALPIKQGNWHIKGEDVAYEEMLPVAEAQTTVETPVATPQTVVQEPVEELFPDDFVSVGQELENLRLQQRDIMGGLEAAVAVGDYGTVAMLTQEYEDVTAKIRELESQEADRFDSLMKDADSLLPVTEQPVKQKEVTANSPAVLPPNVPAKAPVALPPNAPANAPVVLPPNKGVPANAPVATKPEIKTVKERLTAKLTAVEAELANNRKLREESWAGFDNEIAGVQAQYNSKSNKNTVAANDLLRRIERLNRMKHSADADYAKRISDLEAKVSKVSEEVRTGNSPTEQGAMRQELHSRILSNIRSRFEASGFDFDTVLKNAKNLSTFATVDNTPQRVMEKALGYKQGKILSDITVDQVARNETKGIQWLNSFTDRKNGVLAKLSKQYGIKPGSKASAAAQMYAEGFYVNGKNEIVQYGDAELAQDFPDASVQNRIKGLARDPRIRQIYDATLAAINQSRARNAYPEIPRLDNYFLHFRAMDDTFSRLGLPFNPNDIKAKDLPTDLNGVTADLKPGQPYFASAMHRTGKRTSFDLLGGLERYLNSAKNQIYHIDDIQTLRALRNYVADTYGQAKGLESLDLLTEEEAQERIKQVYGSHLSTFAKFLNEEANVIAGKTALIDRGLEGIFGRRAITFLNTVDQQVGKNMVGYNVSSSLTNFLAPVQAFAKTNKFDFVKALAQTTANKVGSIFGKGDGFAESSPVMIRRKGADSFYRTPWQKAGDAGYFLMSAVDNISTELIARAKYNELTRKGMDSQTAHTETDKWVSRLMGDRSIGQQPQLYNSKLFGIIAKFQLEVRNQLDSQFYDTIQEAKVSNEEIQNGLARNAKTAAKVTSTFFQLAVAQHLFGKAFESIAGYNPAFDIISVIAKMFGWDDEEDDEDTALDNIEEGFLELLGDLPYTSTLTGGRIPISSALPIEELFTGEDQYGNKVHENPFVARFITAGKALPYYLLPGGYGQIKKTTQGLGMFDDDLPISGSYTDSGNLRFPVEDTPLNRIQAGLFGQYASENARDYFDNERSPLKPKQTQEFIDSELPIRDYWDYREGLSGLGSLDAQGDYIGGLDLPISTKNLFVNNIADREEDIDMTNYDKYPNFHEFDWGEQNREKYAFLQEHGMSYADYENLDEDSKSAYSWAFNNPEKYEFVKGFGLSATDYYSLDEDSKEAYSWAYNNPESYTFSRAVTDDVVEYRQYARELNAIKADKDRNGKTISGSRKDKVFVYIMDLDIDAGAKAILFKSEYPSEDTDNEFIIEYLNSRKDISNDEKVAILKKLGFKVDSRGRVTW